MCMTLSHSFQSLFCLFLISFIFYRKNKPDSVRIGHIFVCIQPKSSLLRFTVNNRDIPNKSFI